jgi:anti-sigma factor RsiW
MTCEHHEEQISALVDHELGDEESRGLFVHLSTCEMCRRSLQTVLDLRSDLHAQGSLTAPTEMDEKVISRITSAQRAQVDRKAIPRLAWHGRVSAPLPVAAGIALMLMIGSFLLSSVWPISTRPSAKENPEVLYMTIIPTVEVRAYELETTTISQ